MSDRNTPPTSLSGYGPVTRSMLEQGLERARAAAPGPVEGVFGPQSSFWRHGREALAFLGAGRALVLQTAHPWVAAGVADHSTSLQAPIARFHRTFQIVFSLTFGSVDQAAAKARLVHAIHSRITGTMAETVGPFTAGSPYRANDVEAMLWVHTTLWDTAMAVRESLLGPLESAQKEAYYQESRRFAWLFGIPDDVLPPDWVAFRTYADGVLASNLLGAGRQGRMIVNALLRGEGEQPRPWLPFWFYAMTVESLPPRLRDAFAMPYGEREAQAAARWRARLRWLYPRLPELIRYVAPYHEACGRIAGRPAPGPMTRLLNRAWVGVPSLVP